MIYLFKARGSYRTIKRLICLSEIKRWQIPQLQLSSSNEQKNCCHRKLDHRDMDLQGLSVFTAI